MLICGRSVFEQEGEDESKSGVCRLNLAFSKLARLRPKSPYLHHMESRTCPCCGVVGLSARTIRRHVQTQQSMIIECSESDSEQDDYKHDGSRDTAMPWAEISGSSFDSERDSAMSDLDI